RGLRPAVPRRASVARSKTGGIVAAPTDSDGTPLGDGPAAGEDARFSASRADSVGRAGAGGSTKATASTRPIGEPAGAGRPFERTTPSATTSTTARIVAILRARGERRLGMSVTQRIPKNGLKM